MTNVFDFVPLVGNTYGPSRTVKGAKDKNMKTSILRDFLSMLSSIHRMFHMLGKMYISPKKKLYRH